MTRVRDLVFRMRYVFRGVPKSFGNRTFRLDESLRRWNTDCEEKLRGQFDRFLHSGDCAVDVGANFGLHTLYMADLVGANGLLWAFEPMSQNAKLLRRNIRLNGFEGRTKVVEAAVSDSEDERVAFCVGNSGGVDVTAAMVGGHGRRGNVVVRNVRLDFALRERNQPVRLIKIDVEGAELEVLRGARDLVTADGPAIVLELHPGLLPDFGETAESVEAWLDAMGYRSEVIDRQHEGRREYRHLVCTR